MTNMEKFAELYREKREQGLVDVKFVFQDGVENASSEEIAGELLALDEAVKAGRSTPLDFGDLSLRRTTEKKGPNMRLQPTLYILMRTDMKSMNAGKGMAQAAHAANAFIYYSTTGRDYIQHWQGVQHDNTQGFGTTIVLAVDSEQSMRDAVAEAQKQGFIADLVLDHTYPIRDGGVTHLVPVTTCGYVFTACHKAHPVFALNAFNLHP